MYFYSLSTYIIKCKRTGEKVLLIFYTKPIRPDVIISFNALSSIWNSIIIRARRKYQFFVLNSRNGIIDSQRDPAARKCENLLTWFPRRCHIRFRSWHILPVILFFFFFSSGVDVISDRWQKCRLASLRRNTDLSVEILKATILKATISESDSREFL